MPAGLSIFLFSRLYKQSLDVTDVKKKYLKEFLICTLRKPRSAACNRGSLDRLEVVHEANQFPMTIESMAGMAFSQDKVFIQGRRETGILYSNFHACHLLTNIKTLYCLITIGTSTCTKQQVFTYT